MTVPEEGEYRVIMTTDEGRFGGWDRVSKERVYSAVTHPDGHCKLQIYLPARTAVCIQRVKPKKSSRTKVKRG